MSHVVAAQVEISDLDALEAACKEMGATLVRNQKTFTWYGRWVGDYGQADAAYRNGVKTEDYGKCDHAIRVPGVRYEVGVVKQPNGKFKLVYDFYGNDGHNDGQQLKAKFGDGCATLIEGYTTHKVLQDAKKRGHIAQRFVNIKTGKPLVAVGVGSAPQLPLNLAGQYRRF